MILGIDFSLTSTGVCAIDKGSAECITVGSKQEQVWQEFPDRVKGIIHQALDWADTKDPIVLIESPAFGAKGSALDRMFGGWWLAVEALVPRSGALFKVTPGQIKKFATGNGAAKKDAVMLAVARRHPEVEFQTNDESDAFVLASIGAAAFGEPYAAPLTQYQQEIVDAVRAGRKELK